MKNIRLFIITLVILSFMACKNHSDTTSYNDEDISYTDEVDQNENVSYTGEIEEEAYSDGTYCADVEYYNPNTGTHNTYTLNVEVENNELTLIHWPNGGWLDDSHFSPEALDSNGSCSFTSDKGYQYDIQINGPECSYTDDVQEDENENAIEEEYSTEEEE